MSLKDFFNNNPFKGFFKENRLRPPGAVDEKKFMELCIRCARCIEVCPYNSIKRADLYEKLLIGTPFVFADEKACYICMKCPSVCPTGALNPEMADPEKITMGHAVINQETCLNYIYYKEEETGVVTGNAQICNTCYNVCPLTDKAIVMEKFLLPVTTDKCIGCGICTEKCPTKPKSINIIPTGMARETDTGFYYEKYKMKQKKKESDGKVNFKGDKLIERKKEISSFGEEEKFKYDFEIQEKIDGWD